MGTWIHDLGLYLKNNIERNGAVPRPSYAKRGPFSRTKLGPLSLSDFYREVMGGVSNILPVLQGKAQGGSDSLPHSFKQGNNKY